MFFKEQAKNFEQLIISKANSPILVSWYLLKKKLTRMLIHIRISLPLHLCKKNKNENMEYHGTLITFKSQLY